jgi:serine protease Do
MKLKCDVTVRILLFATLLLVMVHSQSQIEARELEGWPKLVETAVLFADSIEEADHKDWALNEIAVALAMAGHIEQALEVALSIENTVNKGLTFGDIGVELAKAGNIDRALEVAHSIPDKTECADCNHYALRYIAEALAKAGNLDLALDVVRSLENITDKVWVLQDIAAVVAEAGNAQAIEKILKETRQVAHSIEAGEPEVSNKVWALRFRGTVLAKAGNVQEGERILKQALEVARSIEDPAHRDTALWNIATAFIEAGRIEHALDLVRALESIESHASSKAWSLRNIAGALAEVGNIQQAENVLKRL